MELAKLQRIIEHISLIKGWHEGVTPIEVLAHAHAELSEVFEELRKEEIDRKSLGIELCDVIVTVVDLASLLGVELSDVMPLTLSKINGRNRESGLTKGPRDEGVPYKACPHGQIGPGTCAECEGTPIM